MSKRDRKDPRSVRGAEKRGWKIVEVKHRNDVSYLGLIIWTDRSAKGKYISSFSPTRFAFELDGDAAWFALRWT